MSDSESSGSEISDVAVAIHDSVSESKILAVQNNNSTTTKSKNLKKSATSSTTSNGITKSKRVNNNNKLKLKKGSRTNSTKESEGHSAPSRNSGGPNSDLKNPTEASDDVSAFCLLIFCSCVMVLCLLGCGLGYCRRAAPPGAVLPEHSS